MSAVTILIPVLAAAIAAQREELLTRLRTANATSADAAVALEFDGGSQPSILPELLRSGEVRRTADGLYWVDEPRVAAVGRRQARKLAKFGLGLMGLALAGLGVALLANR